MLGTCRRCFSSHGPSPMASRVGVFAAGLLQRAHVKFFDRLVWPLGGGLRAFTSRPGAPSLQQAGEQRCSQPKRNHHQCKGDSAPPGSTEVQSGRRGSRGRTLRSQANREGAFWAGAGDSWGVSSLQPPASSLKLPNSTSAPSPTTTDSAAQRREL